MKPVQLTILLGALVLLGAIVLVTQHKSAPPFSEGIHASSTPSLIKPIVHSDWYGTDGTDVYIAKTPGTIDGWQKIEGADPASFVVLEEHANEIYAKDKTGFYMEAQRFEVADPTTFTATDYSRVNGYPHFFKDRLHLYQVVSSDNHYALEIVANADPASFVVIPTKLSLDWSSLYAYDKNQFYCFRKPVPEIDVSAAHVKEVYTNGYVSDEYVEDKNGEHCRWSTGR